MDLNMKENGLIVIQKIGRSKFIQRLWNVVKEEHAQEKFHMRITNFHKYYGGVVTVINSFVISVTRIIVTMIVVVWWKGFGLIGTVALVPVKNVFHNGTKEEN
eukprot:TRINITY_DN5918_c1_g1_i3.p3 TRINITY_DN5918_c1_g1~~TRINITY_DN5918_c1_g1_i3.p3  ORF type:complete len:103 (-),score=13.80 TRINITY_DN5918_c1_g1_i3:32-340(-)